MANVSEVADLSDLVRLDDPDFFLDDPYTVYARMQRHRPVLWCPDVNLFAITKYEDVRGISRDPKLFSSAAGIMLNDAKYRRNISAEFYPPAGELITITDPPRQLELRRAIAPAFTPAAIASMEPRIRDCAQRLVAAVEPGAEIDFISKIAVVLPIQVICALLGIPDAKVEDVHRWSDDMVKMGAPVSSEELDELAGMSAPVREYLLEQLAAKRGADPSSDLMSALAAAVAEGRSLTELNVLIMTTAVMVAGNETTRNLLGSMAWALAQHPDQLARLRADPTLTPNAVEESLRWMSPVIAHLRTATHDTELRGQQIQAGQPLHLLYAAANHDEDVFPSPARYDIARPESALHIAFGQGPHVCAGASLARLEARVLFEEILQRFSSWEVSAEPTRLRSILHNGITHLPLRFAA